MGRERDVCLWKLRANQAQKMADLIQKNMGNCKESKSPQQCTAVGKEKMAKYNSKAQKYLDKIKTYKAKDPKKSDKADIGLLRAKQAQKRMEQGA